MGYSLSAHAERRRNVPSNAFPMLVFAISALSGLTTVGGTADGTRQSTVGTLNMGTCGYMGWYWWSLDLGHCLCASDVPSTYSPSHGGNEWGTGGVIQYAYIRL